MDKVALVTGAATRVGRALALHLASKGYNLAIHCNSSKAAAAECQELAAGEGVKAMIVMANLADDKQVAGIIPQVHKDLGEISVLVNNASVFNPQEFMDTSQEQFTMDMAINLKAPFFLTQSFAKQVTNKASGAGEKLVVNLLDSMHAKLVSNHFIYRLAKHSLHHLTMLTAKELAPQIRVNGIAPGPALPPPGKSEAHLATVTKNTPLGIISPPETLVAGLDYLLGAKTVTGQVLYIGSGMHLQ